jgi:hypothetical protein
MIMTTPRRLKMHSIPLKTAMSERKKLRRMMLSSGAGEENRYMTSLLLRPNQVLADKIMTPLELLRLLLPRQPRRVSSPLKTTWTCKHSYPFITYSL